MCDGEGGKRKNGDGKAPHGLSRNEKNRRSVSALKERKKSRQDRMQSAIQKQQERHPPREQWWKKTSTSAGRKGARSSRKEEGTERIPYRKKKNSGKNFLSKKEEVEGIY